LEIAGSRRLLYLTAIHIGLRLRAWPFGLDGPAFERTSVSHRSREHDQWADTESSVRKTQEMPAKKVEVMFWQEVARREKWSGR
jgi:hypothetical protein